MPYRMHVFACVSALYLLYLIFHSICALQRWHTSDTCSAFMRIFCGVLSCRSFLKANVFLCFCARWRVAPAPWAELIVATVYDGLRAPNHTLRTVWWS